MQVEEILQQLPARGKSRRHELDERFGIVRRDVLVGERRAQQRRVRRLRDAAGGIDAQRFLLDPLAPALEDLRLAAVDQAGKASLKDAIDTLSSHESACRSAAGYSVAAV